MTLKRGSRSQIPRNLAKLEVDDDPPIPGTAQRPLRDAGRRFSSRHGHRGGVRAASSRDPNRIRDSHRRGSGSRVLESVRNTLSQLRKANGARGFLGECGAGKQNA